jgi:phosphatidylinositol alpha-1,6-mannosyltransferase
VQYSHAMRVHPAPERRPVVLILGEEIPPCTGGVAQWGYWMARTLADRGLEVVYAARDDYARPSAYYGNSFTVLPIPGGRWKQKKELRILGALWAAWRRWRPRAVVCLNCKVARVPLLLRPLTGWKVAVMAHGMEITKKGHYPRRRIGLRWAFGSADLTVAVSRYTRTKVLDVGVDPGHVRVLPCGVDPGLFRPGDGAAVRDRLGIGGRPVVLSISRLVPRKGHDLVIRAFAEVRRRMPDAVYLLAGTGRQTYVDDLRALAVACGVGEAVRFLGYVESRDLPGLYSASDVYVMTSRNLDDGANYEGFGITYLEANACGVPVIGADVGGVADAIVDGETGYLVPPNDVPAIAGRLHRLLSDAGLAARMGEAGRVRVRREFTWDRVGGRFLEALEERTGPLVPRHADGGPPGDDEVVLRPAGAASA